MTRRAEGEQGAALIAALVFVTIAAVFLGATLSFADTDFRTTIAVREQRKEAYAADAAVEAAIRNYQVNGKTCPVGWTAPVVNDVSGITVSCSADGSNAPTLSNAPTYSILTRGSAPDDGIRAVSGALTPARGGVFSEGRVDVAPTASLRVVDGDVTVKGACTGNIDVEPPGATTCNYPGASPADPPGITSAPAVPSAAPTPRAVPPCPGNGAPIVFQPGTYTDFNGLRALFTSCASKVFHLAPAADGPGFYWFNFPTGGDWAIGNDEVLVGGTLTGPLSSIAGAAVGKKCDETQQGVQLIFSGEARLSVAAEGVVELCPPLFGDSTTQRVTIYGPQGTVGAPVVTSGIVPTTAVSNGSPKFDVPAKALVADDLPATASVPAGKDAKLTVGGFVLPVMPAGTVVTQVAVTVKHKETATPGASTLTAKVTGGTGGNARTANVTTFTRSTAYAADTFDLSSTFTSAASLSGLAVELTAATPTGLSETYVQDIDAVSLTVGYAPVTPGVFAPQSGCIVSGATCPFIQTQGQARFTSKGTIYAPQAMLNIQLVDQAEQVFGRGVIVRRLDTNFTSANECNIEPLPATEEYDSCYAFQLPRDRTLGDNVVFTASLGGRTLLRVYVNFTGATPVVRQWSSVNEPA